MSGEIELPTVAAGHVGGFPLIILAIDQGTSGTKALLADPAEGILAVAEESLRPVYLLDGGVEQDPGTLLKSVLDAAVAPSRAPVARLT